MSSFTKNLPILISILFDIYFTFANGATFKVVNQCGYTVWAAAKPGGGRQLDKGQTWSFDVPAGTTGGRVWGRTNCNFDANGQGQCETGDCGLRECQGYGRAPNTLAEFELNQLNNLDSIDISLVDGFNIPMTFTGIGCRDIVCNATINDQCPPELRVPGGCNNPCTTFGGNQYCCTNGRESCGPTSFSRFFKQRCPTAYSYPQDDESSTFTCPSGTNYKVVFCPYAFSKATTFDIRNNCSFTIWAAAIPGGGRQLDQGQTWSLNVSANTTGRIWARTNCNFDKAGRGRCQTGDCNGVRECLTFGAPPNTIAEYSLNQINNLHYFDISLVDGFNVPMDFSPNSGSGCGGIRCAADVNGKCPNQLRSPGGCNNPCTIFRTDQYCCTSNSGNCGPTDFSKFLKARCPDAYSYPQDDASSTFTCPGGTNYRVVFCP